MSVKYDFSGKRVLVTGGAKGLGRSIVEKFVSSGATVFALDNNEAQLQQLKESLPSVTTICVDLLDWDESKKKVESLAPIHHLVNNAGIVLIDYFNDIGPQSIDKIFGVNFKALINMGQAMAKGLKETGTSGGTIVNISSIMDNKSVPGAGLYSCTKAAVTMLTKVMALELEPQGIRVNSVRPTIMATELISQGKEIDKKVAQDVLKFCLERQINKNILTVEETSNVVLYLSSNASEMVNGSDILVDGGLYAN